MVNVCHSRLFHFNKVYYYYCFSISALVVRFITKRFIGEYARSLGKIFKFFLLEAVTETKTKRTN